MSDFRVISAMVSDEYGNIDVLASRCLVNESPSEWVDILDCVMKASVKFTPREIIDSWMAIHSKGD